VAGYVLIVESDPELQRRIGDALREGHYELASEAEGKWAQRSIAVRAPDAVVLDTQLSDGDGFRLADELRRDPDTRDAPIFFIASAHRGASHRAEARRRFAPAEYLEAPLDTNSLLALLLQALPPGTGTGDVSANPPRAAQAPDVAGLVAALDGVLTDPVQQRERRKVERAAKSIAGEKLELQGTLKRVPFARLLQRLYAQKATGSLLLLRDTAKKDATKKIIAFVDGYPVSVKSNVLGECLGQILVSRRLISEKALADSVTRMQAEKRQQGQILVEMGALSPYNLQRALVEQVEAKLLEVFAWPDGKFMFKESEVSFDDTSPGQALLLVHGEQRDLRLGFRRWPNGRRRLPHASVRASGNVHRHLERHERHQGDVNLLENDYRFRHAAADERKFHVLSNQPGDQPGRGLHQRRPGAGRQRARSKLHLGFRRWWNGHRQPGHTSLRARGNVHGDPQSHQRHGSVGHDLEADHGAGQPAGGVGEFHVLSHGPCCR